MLWRKVKGQPETDSLATPVMLLVEDLYHNDQCLLDSAAILLPIQSLAITVLWIAVSAIRATTVDHVILAMVLYYCVALCCLHAIRPRRLGGLRMRSLDERPDRFADPVDHLEVMTLATPKAVPLKPLSSLLDEAVTSSCL